MVTQDPQAWIAQIRKDIEASRNARLWKDSIHMLNTVSESIFSRSAHFILELLQNAEDAASRAGVGHGEITFRISPSRILVTHNGGIFSPDDVDAICGVRSTKKTEQGTLGYLGIGFKSLFKVTDCPQIHSGGFHFKYDRNAHSDPTNELWQITPVWLDGVNQTFDPVLTTFVLPFRSEEAYRQTLEELKKLDVHVFLFLRHLRKLRILDDATDSESVIERLGERHGVASLRKNGHTHRFIILRCQKPVPPEVSSDPALEFYRRQNVKQREVILAFAVDDSGNLQPIEDASTLGSVSSFLPLVEERSGAKFLIQSDFLVQPGREAVQYELSWNRWLIQVAGELALEAVAEFKKHPTRGKQFLLIFKFTPYPGQAAFEKLFKPYLQEPVSAYLRSADVYPTASGGHVKPEQALQLDETLQGLISDAELPFFYSRKDLRIADPDLNSKSLPDDIQSLPQRLDLGQVARNLRFLEQKCQLPNHMQWFLDLCTGMAESGQQFKVRSTRSSRGRYTAYEDPIYILTDANKIVSARLVSLRQIPQDVLDLRTQFPEVEKLLSSYHLIHPQLETSLLSPFFKDQTHIQSFDYHKLCREVLWPKAAVSRPAPSKDELIGYTRLLQKGPEIRGYIWVVTKNGHIKPSNQVFLGTDYSPAEDWERTAQFSPQIEFLSDEYLQGVSRQDVPAWKEYFLKIGVKESGEGAHVETYAVAFIQNKLSAELYDFLAKDRHQYGYDLEAKRRTDNALVKIECKGRKKEAAIDLDGNEPKAAQQTQMNGEPFWVCIVTGIPENPELWVVENVTDPKVGEYSTLTIPVSKWKMFGRRIP